MKSRRNRPLKARNYRIYSTALAIIIHPRRSISAIDPFQLTPILTVHFVPSLHKLIRSPILTSSADSTRVSFSRLLVICNRRSITFLLFFVANGEAWICGYPKALICFLLIVLDNFRRWILVAESDSDRGRASLWWIGEYPRTYEGDDVRSRISPLRISLWSIYCLQSFGLILSIGFFGVS